MKKQIMTAFAVSTMMTLAMPFASFAVARSCQTGFRPENNCGYTGTSAVSAIQMQGGCVISSRNAIDLYTLLGKGYPNGAAGNNCSSGCTAESKGSSCSFGTNCGTNSCAGGNCSTNNCGSGNCLTSGNVSIISGTACGSLVNVR